MRKTKKAHSVKSRRHKSKGGVKFKTPRPYHKTSGTPSALRLREKNLSIKSVEPKPEGNLTAEEALILNIPRIRKRMEKEERKKTIKKLEKMRVNNQLDKDEKKKQFSKHFSKHNKSVKTPTLSNPSNLSPFSRYKTK